MGGKDASPGEPYSMLLGEEVKAPNGFAVMRPIHREALYSAGALSHTNRSTMKTTDFVIALNPQWP